MTETTTEEITLADERFEAGGETGGGQAELVYSGEDVHWLHQTGISEEIYNTPQKAKVLRNTMAENPDFAMFVLEEAKTNAELAEVIEVGDPDEDLAFESQEHNLLSTKYLNHELLTKEQEIALAKRVERGDLSAKDEFIKKNLKLVASIALKYKHYGLEFDDLFENGCIGLQRAVEKFDWRRGYKFSTYATWWVKQAVRRGLANESRPIRLPMHVGGYVRGVSRAEAEWAKSNPEPRTATERDAQIDAVARKTKLSRQKVEELRKVKDTVTSIASLDKVVDPDSHTVLSELLPDFQAPDPVKEVITSDRAEKLREGIARLTEREQQLLTMRFGLDGAEPMNLQGLAGRLGISPQRTHQVEAGAMRKLSSLLKESFGEEPSLQRAGDEEPDDYQRGETPMADELLDHLQIYADGIGERYAIYLKDFTDDYAARTKNIANNSTGPAKNSLAAKGLIGWKRDSNRGIKVWLTEEGAKA